MLVKSHLWTSSVFSVRDKNMRMLRMVTVIGLAACMVGCGEGQGPKGDPGPAGPPGVQGPAGPPSPASGVRVIRSNCDEKSCTVQCNQDETLINAYCGAGRIPAVFPTERSATCRARGPANNPLVAACTKSSIQ